MYTICPVTIVRSRTPHSCVHIEIHTNSSARRDEEFANSCSTCGIVYTNEGTLWSVTRRINCEVATPMQFGMLKTNPWIIWAIGPSLSHKCPTNVAKFARNSKCATQNLTKAGFTGYFRPKLSALRIKNCCTIFFRSKYDQKREFFRILKFASGYSMLHHAHLRRCNIRDLGNFGADYLENGCPIAQTIKIGCSNVHVDYPLQQSRPDLRVTLRVVPSLAVHFLQPQALWRNMSTRPVM